jgi:hypothetical protein
MDGFISHFGNLGRIGYILGDAILEMSALTIRTRDV